MLHVLLQHFHLHFYISWGGFDSPLEVLDSSSVVGLDFVVDAVGTCAFLVLEGLAFWWGAGFSSGFFLGIVYAPNALPNALLCPVDGLGTLLFDLTEACLPEVELWVPVFPWDALGALLLFATEVVLVLFELWFFVVVAVVSALRLTFFFCFLHALVWLDTFGLFSFSWLRLISSCYLSLEVLQ